MKDCPSHNRPHSFEWIRKSLDMTQCIMPRQTSENSTMGAVFFMRYCLDDFLCGLSLLLQHTKLFTSTRNRLPAFTITPSCTLAGTCDWNYQHCESPHVRRFSPHYAAGLGDFLNVTDQCHSEQRNVSARTPTRVDIGFIVRENGELKYPRQCKHPSFRHCWPFCTA